MAFQISEVRESLKGARLEFVIGPAPCAFVNGLRRILLSEIPMLALSRVEIRKNRTRMSDDTVEHRLRMLPVRLRPQSHDWASATCGLEVENKRTTPMAVDTDLFLCEPADLIVKDRDLQTPHHFLTLLPGEALRFKAFLNLEPPGQSHVFHCAYAGVPDPLRCVEPRDAYVKQMSEDLKLRLPEMTEEQAAKHYATIFDNHFAQEYCHSDRYRFSLETDGIVAPRELLKEAATKLLADTRNFLDLSETPPRRAMDSQEPTAWVLSTQKHGHTVLALVTHLLQEDPRVRFASYHRVHQKLPDFELRMNVDSPEEALRSALQAVASLCSRLIQSPFAPDAPEPSAAA